MANPFTPELAQQLFSNDTWPIRRRWLSIGAIGLALNCQAILIYALYRGVLDPALVELFMSLLAALLSIFFAFVFGAIWDDSNKRGHIASILKKDDAT